ncbi:MAG: DUF4401 domain-containing protein [Phyllobacteriaceae bacterium]|nr:DUF4401 domain-containing protein [Phyllobacteriaceae bacterium]
MTRPSIDAATLLAVWRQNGDVPPEAEPEVVAAVRALAAEDEPPLHLKILSAVGTALATAFFLAFMVVARLISFESGGGLVAWGVIFLAAGIGLQVAARGAPVGLGRDVLAQTAFAATALGKIAAVGGAVHLAGVGTAWVPTAALLAVTVATYPVSGSSLDRLLSPYAVAVSALFEILGRRASGIDPSLGLFLFEATATIVAGALLLPDRVPAALRPIGSAALAAMGTVVCLIATGHDAGAWVNDRPIDPRPIEALLTLAAIATLAWAGGGPRALARPPLAAAAIGAGLIGLAGAPGILFALGVLIVGHARHDVALRVIGILALPGFLALWYWGRDMTLLEKSAALVGSGLLLLLGRAAVSVFGWDREEAR